MNPTLDQHPIAAVLLPIAIELPQALHSISAGFPSPATDYLDDGLDVNSYLVQHQAASFFFTVEGDSMAGAGILPGDKILVDRAIQPVHWHIVVAVVSSEYTLKRLYRRNGVIELHAENPKYSPIRINDGDDLIIWGVVVGVVRKIRT